MDLSVTMSVRYIPLLTKSAAFYGQILDRIPLTFYTINPRSLELLEKLSQNMLRFVFKPDVHYLTDNSSKLSFIQNLMNPVNFIESYYFNPYPANVENIVSS